MKKALICGISGQDGAYLAKLLLEKGYEVFGGSRNAQVSSFHNLQKLNIKNDVVLSSINTTDFRNILQSIIKIQPDEIYNLAGQTSVGLSFEQPVETLESISMGSLYLLEAIRFSNLPIKLYNPCSSECFGDTGNSAANELTPFHPRSPYAVAKSTAFWQVSNYREAYKLFACSGILYNHESPLRPEHFVTKKIISTACRIYKGSKEKLILGDIGIQRDWGWAPEYVEAMWLMLQRDEASDYVIATGKTTPLKEFISVTFETLNLNWQDFVIIDESLFRPTELRIGKADPSKAYRELGWQANYQLKDIIENIVEHELSLVRI